MCATLDEHSAFPGGPRANPASRWAAEDGIGNPAIAEQSDQPPQGGAAAVLTGSDGAGGTYAVPLEGLDEKQRKLILAAMDLVGKDRLEVRGRTFTLDCTGVVLAAYWGAGYDLLPLFNRETGNGVKRLHDMAKTGGTLKSSGLPAPGDIIIWDDTYDKDGNGAWGDEFTHNGMVLAVEPNGQITYLHHNYARGIVLARMNLNQVETYQDAEGRETNSPMRMRSDRHIRPEKWLSSHLFRAYAPVLELL